MTTADQVKAAKKAGVDAAMSVAEDIATGRVDTAQLDVAVQAECRELFGRVAGEGDPLWDLHVSVARQVLGLDGIPVDELAEWLAVSRAAQGVEVVEAVPSWIERALAAFDDDEDGAS
ncbi:flagellar hook-length control protein [Mycobacterium sp. DL440]|uniref:flagellar hook-length control protein n=1 Tax=Mycobacterium sp. DL440 TaxID=2675523 RepID=UPI0014217FC8|nr:flagellar hook-length control protein [Mycobacterium sp. DL440]